MAEHTVTYDEKVRGWTSFHSYIPEASVNLNNEYFTFKNGELYLHNKVNGDRNTFYGESYNTEVEVVANAEPSDVKIFKTIEIEGDKKDWDVTVVTDLDEGHIDSSSFEEKEGFYYSYIRRNSDDLVETELLSVQGVGNIQIVNNNVFTFISVPSNINIGDVLFMASGSQYNRIGAILNKDGTTITVGAAEYVPSANDFAFVAKDPVAESYGLKGYYANVRLVSEVTDPIELYAVNSEVAKSFP